MSPAGRSVSATNGCDGLNYRDTGRDGVCATRFCPDDVVFCWLEANPNDEGRTIAWVRTFYRDMFADTGGVPVPGDICDGAMINGPYVDLADRNWTLLRRSMAHALLQEQLCGAPTGQAAMGSTQRVPSRPVHSSMIDPNALRGRIAVVAGATRGSGPQSPPDWAKPVPRCSVAAAAAGPASTEVRLRLTGND